MKTLTFEKTAVKKLPKTPGVYIFKNSGGAPIYIGKAKSLYSRVISYLAVKLEPKTANMVSEAKKLSFIEVLSEIDALLLEARLVRLHQPKYNIQLKDDKTPLYVGITKDYLPRVVLLRKTQLKEQELKNSYGPFVSAHSIKRLLKFLKRVFPYSTHKPSKRLCFYAHIGQCTPCPSEIVNTPDQQTRQELRASYLKNITSLKKLFTGGLPSLRKGLEIKMRSLSAQEKFEEAKKIADQIKTIDYLARPSVLSSVYISDPNLVEDVRKKETDNLYQLLLPHLRVGRLSRIECYDVAHLAGSSPTASMVTFVNGVADKRYYRHFRIKKAKKGDDYAAMAEVLARRSKYFASWGKPDLIIVDGGKGQVSASHELLAGKVPVIGLAKRLETIVIRKGDAFVQIRLPKGPALNLVQRLRDEAHRFARRYHHKLVARALLPH